MTLSARRVRGALGMGVTWSAAWALLGALMTMPIVQQMHSRVPGRVILSLIASGAVQFGIGGFLTGVAFSGVLSSLAARGGLRKISIPRFSLYGAVAGAIPATGILALAAARHAHVTLASAVALLTAGALLGSISGALTLRISRAGMGSVRDRGVLDGSENDLVTAGELGSVPQHEFTPQSKVRRE